jgi:hypothetical protein
MRRAALRGVLSQLVREGIYYQRVKNIIAMIMHKEGQLSRKLAIKRLYISLNIQVMGVIKRST